MGCKWDEMAEASDRKGAGKKTSSMKRDQRSVLHEQEPDDANSNDWRMETVEEKGGGHPGHVITSYAANSP